MADLEFTKESGVATILLNRPDRRNAFTLAMVDDWVAALGEIRDDDAIRVAITRGAGGAYCSGLDLDGLAPQSQTPLENKQMLNLRVQNIARTVEQIDKPLIACVSGPAVGAGMDTALMCDLRIGDPTARFCESYLRVGLVPGAGGLYYLPRVVGLPKAFEMFLTAEFVDAEEAYRIGLLNRLVDAENLLEATHDLATKLAAAPPQSARIIKRALYQSAKADLATALDLASSHMGVVASTEDSAEAMAAFQQRREAKYKGF